jgi:hypothetical protein
MQEHVKATMGLNINPFTKAAHKAKQATKGLGRSLKSALGFFGASFAVHRLASSVSGFADKLVDTSRKLGVSTDFLQAWNFSALQIGITTETSNMALQRFGRRLGEAARGQGVLAAVVREGNIELRDGQGHMRATTDVLADYADMVQNASSANEQLRLSNLAFDSEGVGLVTMLREGSAGMQSMVTSARELGAVINNQALVAINRLSTKLKMLGTQGLGFVAKKTGNVIEGFQLMVDHIGGELSGLSFDEAVKFAVGEANMRDAVLNKIIAENSALKDITAEKEKQATLEVQKIAMLNKQIAAQKALETAKQDKTKSTVDEVAGGSVRDNLNAFFQKQRARGLAEKQLRERAALVTRRGGDASGLIQQADALRFLIRLGGGVNPRQLAENRVKAQRIQQLEAFAKELGDVGNQVGAQQAMGIAAGLRRQMGGLTSAEQNPNAALEAAVAKSTTELQTVNTQIAEIKAAMNALNTP